MEVGGSSCLANLESASFTERTPWGVWNGNLFLSSLPPTIMEVENSSLEDHFSKTVAIFHFQENWKKSKSCNQTTFAWHVKLKELKVLSPPHQPNFVIADSYKGIENGWFQKTVASLWRIKQIMINPSRDENKIRCGKHEQVISSWDKLDHTISYLKSDLFGKDSANQKIN